MSARTVPRSIYIVRVLIGWLSSVLQLCLTFPDSEITPLRLFAYPFPIVMVSVTDRSLRSYARKHILRRDETDYVVLTVPESSSTDYRRWHAGEVEGLPQLT